MTASLLHGVNLVELANGARTITVSASSVIGIVGTAEYADPAAFPLDTPVLVQRPSDFAALTATAAGALDVGSLPGALAGIFDVVSTPVVVVRVDTITSGVAGQLAEVVGDPATGQGVYALLTAESRNLPKPKILIAPGHTHQQLTGGAPPAALANPVVAALAAVAGKLRACAVADGPNDTNAHAIAKAALEADERVWPVDPFVFSDLSGATAVPTSARAAAVIALTDQRRGYWWSPSNQVIPGVTGLGRPVTFSLSDMTTDAGVLNAGGVATVINAQGFRLWGNRTGAADPAYAFLSVRRTADVFFDAFDAAFLSAVDQPFSAQLLRDVLDAGNAFLRQEKAKGATLGGKFTLDPDLNTAASLQAGQAFYDFDFEPPAPMEGLTLRASRNGGYYDTLITAVTSATQQTAA